MTKTIRPELLETMEYLNYRGLTPVQEQSIPLFMEGNDLYVQAKTGAGKTAAYLIPILNVIRPLEQKTRALIIAPTRELAVQIRDNAERLSAFLKIHTVCLTGGKNYSHQINLLKHHPEIIVGTAGRILDLIRQGLISLDDLKWLVLDEADMLLSLGQRNEVSAVLEYIPQTVQTVMYSATMNESLTSLFPGEYRTVVIDESAVNSSVRQYCVITENIYEDITYLLSETPGKCIVFFNHQSDCTKAVKILKGSGIPAETFHAGLKQNKREQIIREFSSGSLSVLCATDAAARGLDCGGLGLIIHCGLPFDHETYIHRSGRAAHQGGYGCSVLLLTKEESETELGKNLTEYCEYAASVSEVELNPELPDIKQLTAPPDYHIYSISAGKKDHIRKKDVVGALCELLSFNEIGTITIDEKYTDVQILSSKPLPDQLMIKGKSRKIRLNDTLPF